MTPLLPAPARESRAAGLGRCASRAFLFTACVFGSIAIAPADMTRYGFSGIQYVPSAEKSYGPDLSAAFYMPVRHGWESNRYPTGFSMLASLTTWPVEIGLSNTYMLASSSVSNGFDPQIVHGVLPLVPSIKYAIANTPTPWGDWMAAGGFALPYGAYFSAGYRGILWRLQPHVTGGLSSRYTTWHIFGGMELRAVDGDRKPLPLCLAGDFAIGNSLEQLDRIEERFWSIGVKMDAGQHMRLAIAYRRDGDYLDDLENLQPYQNEGLVTLTLQTHLNPLSRRSTR